MRKLLTVLLLITGIKAPAQNGIIWYDPIAVADKTYGNLHPRIILDKNHQPVVLWADENGKAFIARWSGKGFAEPEQINQPGKYVFAEPWAGPEITNHGDTIYVVYKEIPEDKGHIYLKHSYDGGKTFSIETQVDDTDGFLSRFPSVAIDPYGHPLVAYMRMNKGYSNPKYIVVKSKDLGESFAGETSIHDFSGGHISDCCPATVLESGNATVIIYRDNLDGNRNIWAGISMNAGVSFNKGLQLDETNWMMKDCPAHPPHGIVISDTIYSTFMSSPSDTAMVYLGKASISGLKATTNPITGNFTGLISQNFPCISNSGDAAALAWEQTIGANHEICLLFSNEITNGFPKTYEKVSTGLVSNVDVALGGAHIYIIWQDDSSKNIMCRVGSYKETLTNQLLAENTTIYLQPSKSKKYFVVDHTDISSCLMVDAEGKEYEMDIKCKKSGCRVYTEELDPGTYIVRVFCKDDKIYTYKYEVKGDE